MLQPINDRVLVKPIANNTVTRSGIVIPDAAQEKPNRGKVVKVGRGHVFENGKVVPLDVKENDIVLYGRHSGQQIKIDSEDYVVLSEDDILGVFTE